MVGRFAAGAGTPDRAGTDQLNITEGKMSLLTRPLAVAKRVIMTRASLIRSFLPAATLATVSQFLRARNLAAITHLLFTSMCCVGSESTWADDPIQVTARKHGETAPYALDAANTERLWAIALELIGVTS